MFSCRYPERAQSSNASPFWHYSAWVLCGLLLLFCANGRVALHGVQNRNLKLATAQSFLASEEARLEAAIAALLLMGCVAFFRMPRFVAAASPTVAVPPLLAFKLSEYDRESHLRPPPLG